MAGSPAPEITVHELAEKLKLPDPFVLLDVREQWEVQQARITDARLEVVPMSQLARKGLSALPASANSPEAEIYVLCHMGQRSDQVAAWLASQGWTRVFSVAGGIDEYARQIDPTVGTY
jgi:rhodanese-related sulfurtransferase